MGKRYKPNGAEEKLRRWVQIQSGQLREENGLVRREGDNNPPEVYREFAK